MESEELSALCTDSHHCGTKTNPTWCHIPRYQKFLYGRIAHPQISHPYSPILTNLHQNTEIITKITTTLHQYPHNDEPIPINEICSQWRRAHLRLTVSCRERNFQAASGGGLRYPLVVSCEEGAGEGGGDVGSTCVTMDMLLLL